MAFRCVGSPMDEMKLLERMRARDPESADNVVANGKLLVEYVQQGNLRAIQCALDHMQEDHVLLFYSVRMFRTACTGNRLDILRFMLAHGFEMEQVGVRDILHFAIEEIVDEQEAEAAQPLIRFLMEAGADVNWQRQSDLFTALHIACRKNLYAIAYLLIIYGADVNAIAMNDEMPLTCAEQLTSEPLANYSPIDLEQNRLLLSLLEEHNARRTWRKIKQSKAPLAPETKPARKILSISGGFSFSRQPEEPQQQDGTTATAVVGIAAIAAATAGIMLDTPEQEAHSVQPGPLDPVDGLQC
ncbi:hypothetical protein Gpo141_00006056 [Globisporangium polare]